MIAVDQVATPVAAVSEQWWADEPLRYSAFPKPPKPLQRKAKPPPVASLPRTLPQPRPGGWVRAFGECVIRHESGGDPRAENPTSSASGLFQFIDGTWQAWTKRSGVGRSYARASQAPAAIQWAVFSYAVRHHAQRAWAGTHCGYGT